ncbi:hypothetical protein D9M71_513730 [compost metagenome]
MDLDLGIAAHVAGDHAGHQEVEQGGGAGDAHHALGRGLVVVDDRLRRLGPLQHRQAVLVVLQAQFRDRKLPRRAVDQANPQPLLQRRQMAAQLRLGDAQRPAGRTYALVLDDLRVEIQLIQVVHRRGVP